ncbi:MAG: hypothetical protein U0R19_02280 [Bryobacteraceae bacterium]
MAVFAATGLWAQDFPSTSITVTFEPAACGCSEVRIPELWKFPPPYWIPTKIEAKMSPSGHIVLGASPGEGVDSLNHFGILFNRQMNIVRTFPVSPSEWKAARQIQLRAESLLSDSMYKEERASISFLGRDYVKSGKYWGFHFSAALPPQDGKLLAVQSFNGNRMSQPPEAAESTIFIEVYATNAGTPICRIRGTQIRIYPEDLLEDTYWLNNTILLALISPADRRRFLYCDFKGGEN